MGGSLLLDIPFFAPFPQKIGKHAAQEHSIATGVKKKSIYPESNAIFSDISERINDYSDTLDFRGGRVGASLVFRFGGA